MIEFRYKIVKNLGLELLVKGWDEYQSFIHGKIFLKVNEK